MADSAITTYKARVRHVAPLLLTLASFGSAASPVQADLPSNKPLHPLAQASALPPDFDAYVERLRQEWSTPGVAVAVVRPEGTQLKTYGLRQWDQPLKVTERTMFGIASITKSFVAAGIALLVQDGRLKWDDRVVQHLPDFRVLDGWISQNVTLRDLLAHRSGIASHGDMLEEVPGLSEDQVIGRLAHYGQSMPFRAGAEYSSLTYVVLARIIERVSGRPWRSFLRERLWKPLGMQDTHAGSESFLLTNNVLPTGDGWSDAIPTGLAAVPSSVDVAAPHVQWEAFFGGKVIYDERELANRTVHFHKSAIDPGQAAFSSIADMARWAQVLLAPNASVLNPEAVRAMRQLVSVRRGDWPINWHKQRSEPSSDLRSVGFGLGLEIYNYRGRALFGHSGAELGYSSLMVIDPYSGLALIALTNNLTRTFGADHALVQRLLDWHYGLTPTDWSSHYQEAARREHAERLAQLEKLEQERPQTTKTPLGASAAYIGTYESPLIGHLQVRRKGNGLIATTGPSYEIELEPWGDHTFRGTVVSPLRLGFLLDFALAAEGKASKLKLTGIEMDDVAIELTRVSK